MSREAGCPECGARGRKTELDEERHAIQQAIQEEARKQGAVQGDPRWYGINIALTVISERKR